MKQKWVWNICNSMCKGMEETWETRDWQQIALVRMKNEFDIVVGSEAEMTGKISCLWEMGWLYIMVFKCDPVFKKCFKYIFIDFLFREREKHWCERETSIGFFPYMPDQGPNMQPRYVPWPGMNPKPFGAQVKFSANSPLPSVGSRRSHLKTWLRGMQIALS